MRTIFSKLHIGYWSFFLAIIAVMGLGAFLFFPPAASSHAASAERGSLMGPHAPAPEPEAPSSSLLRSSFSPHAPQSLQWSLFNATATFFGIPGLISPVDGLRDEGLGFHADGTTRRAGGSDASRDFSGRRAGAYALSGLDNDRLPWLYDSLAGLIRDRERVWDMGSEYSGLRAKNAATGGGLGGSSYGGTRGVFDSVLMRGLSAGMGFANTALEGAVLGLMGWGQGKTNPYGSGKARFSFYLDADGRSPARLQGEGDILWPLYDSLHTTVYTQFGARSMYGGGQYGGDRWIGNIGIGQRWFPAAKLAEDGKVDSGNWMLGYNAFYDHDLSRGHQRGGVGLEAQYDWLKLGSNWYVPISDWKNSQDFDGRYVRERAARGWDFRVKGYLPFYREVAVTGSFTQWYGEYVGIFGPSTLEKDPRVWSYGVEYTPIPALTAYVNQRQSERGKADTEFGLRFTYNFGMDADEQFKPARVAETRNVHGSRHDFVDRENKIILEYQAKNKINFEYLGYDSTAFNFRIRDGFGNALSGQVVRVTASGATLLAAAPEAEKSMFAQMLHEVRQLFSLRAAHADSGMVYTTNGNGVIRVRVDNVNKMTFLSVAVGGETRSYDRGALNLGPAQTLALKADKNSLPDLGSATLSLSNATADATVTWQVEGTAGRVSGGSKTDAAGKATATFTASGTGTATVTATVGGEKASVVLAIIAGQYTLTVDPAALVANAPTSVTFAVLRDGKAVPQGTAVTFTANANFKNLPSTSTTNASGQIVASGLTGIKEGSHTITIMVENQKAQVQVNVVSSSHTMEVSHATLIQYKPTNVVFTFKSGGVTVPAGTSVTFAANSNFKNLPAAAVTTDANGQVSVNNLTAETAGAQNITANVGGQSSFVSVGIHVNAAALTMEISHTTLTQHKKQNVTFTLKHNGAPVPNGIGLSFTPDPANFQNLPAQRQTTNAQGEVVVNDLTALSKGQKSIEMRVEGYTAAVSASINVTAASYTLEASPATLKENSATSVTFTLQRNGEAVPQDTKVLFTANDNFVDLPATEQKTNAAGQIVVPNLTGKVAGSQTVEVTVNSADKEKAQVNMAVSSAVYSLESDIPALKQYVPSKVTFTVKKSGTPVAANTPVTFTANPSFNLPTAQQLTNAQGEIVVADLTASKAGSQTVEVTVAGIKTSLAFNVELVSYSLETNRKALIQHQPENVTFTVKRGGLAVGQGVTVTFATNDNFVNLPTSAVTNAQGQIIVDQLATRAANAQTIAATVDGQAVSASFSVTAASYVIALNPSNLKQFAATKVAFTVQRNGKAVGAGVPVSFTTNPHFQNLPKAEQTTDANGQITVPNLTTTSGTGQALAVTVAGQTVNALFTVTPVVYALTANPGTLVQHQAETVRFAVTRDGVPVAAGTTVTFESNPNFRNLPGSATTGANGEFSVPHLTALASNSQTVFATVDGQRISTAFSIGSTGYTITPSISALTPHKAQSVTFTVHRNGMAVLAGVAVTFASNPNFKNLPITTLRTNANGQVVLPDLTLTATTAQNLAVTVDGQALSVPMGALNSGYTLLADPYALSMGALYDVAFTVQLEGAPVANAPVTFTSNSNVTGLPASTITDGKGQFVVKGLRGMVEGVHKVEITVAGQRASLNMAVNNGEGVIGVYPSPMNPYLSTSVQIQGNYTLLNTYFTITPNPHFKNLPEFLYFNETSFAFMSDIVAVTPGAQTLELKNIITKQSFYVPILVAPASFTLNADPAVMDVNVAKNMTFTVRANGLPVKNMAVTLTSNPNFSNWPTTATTDNNGQFTINGLTARNAGAQTLQASVSGQNVSATVNVNRSADSLSVSPETLNLGTQTSVTFTLSPNGEALKGLSASFTPNGNLTLPTTPQLINESGSFTVPVTARTTGRHAVEISVDGKKYSSYFTVNSGGYAVSSTTGTLYVKQLVGLTLSLTYNGVPVAAKTPVTFTPNAAFQGLPASVLTDNAGKVYIGLTPQVGGRQSLEVNVNGQKASVVLNVVNAYTVTPYNDPLFMPLNTPMDVFLVIKEHGTARGEVPVNFKSHPLFKNMPTTTQISNSFGVVVARDLVAIGAGAQTLEIEVAGDIHRVPLTVTVPEYSFSIDPVAAGGPFSSQQTATLTARLLKDGAPYPHSATVTWEVMGAVNNSRAMVIDEYNNWRTMRSGLAWGDNHSGVDAQNELTSTAKTNYSQGSGIATVQLTDVLGTRSVKVKASVNMGGDVTHSATREIVFGPGPIEVFENRPKNIYDFADAVAYCGGTFVEEAIGYQPSTNLPTVQQLQTVSGPGAGGNKGAARAAGWWHGSYLQVGEFIEKGFWKGITSRFVYSETGEAVTGFENEPLVTYLVLCRPK